VVLLLPLGYTASREFDDWRGEPGVKCLYTQQIQSEPGGAAPRFVVWPTDTPPSAPDGFECVAADPRGAWTQLAAVVQQARTAVLTAAAAAAAAGGAAGDTSPAKRVTHQSGYHMFGLDSPYIQALLERLPRPAACDAAPNAYTPLADRTRASAAAAAAAAAAANAAAGSAAGDGTRTAPLIVMDGDAASSSSESDDEGDVDSDDEHMPDARQQLHERFLDTVDER
jgi:hypothetical protein